MCLDQVKLISDDAYFTQDHVMFLADKYRAFLLKKFYTDVKKVVPESNYQTVCLNLEKVQGIEGDECSDTYLRSIESIPNLIPVGTPKVSSADFLSGQVTYVSRERMKYVGHNKFLKDIIYCTIGPDGKLYLKSSNPQMYYLERVSYTGIFEDSSKALELSCDESAEAKCEPMDNDFPLEEALIPMLIEQIVKDLVNSYRPEDEANNAKDDLANLSLNTPRNYTQRPQAVQQSQE